MKLGLWGKWGGAGGAAEWLWTFTTRLRFCPEARHRGTVRETSRGPGGHCLYSDTVDITGHKQAGDVQQ